MENDWGYDGRLPRLRLRMTDKLLALQRWAQLGRVYSPRRPSGPVWSAVTRLIIAAKPYLLERASDLRVLLDKSYLDFGMQDPLLNDLGTHRWLDKETSYSDWLAWVLERLEQSAAFEVLGLDPPRNSEHAGKCGVRRESQLGPRYIDLLIYFDGVPGYVVGVEVKTYDEQYSKQKDDLKSLKSRYGKDMPCVLIAIDEDIVKDQLCGFRLRPWRKVTFALRKKIAEYANRQAEGNRIVTVMMLGFVAAAEQNLLEISLAAPRRVWNDEPTLIPEDLIPYLRGDK
jgi:hypothetical protein